MNTPAILRRVIVPLLLAALTGLPIHAQGAKDWTQVEARPTADWVKNSVVYEIFPRQFSATGDFAGITARLDELRALGVDVLWIMPIQPIGHLKAKGSIGSPYAIRDYYAVNPDYGTKDDFHRLVDGAHARGMKVIIDIVANHTSWDSVMMSNPSFYKQDAQGHVIPPHPEWQDVAGLNYNNPQTHEYMRKMLKYWAKEFRLDGIRCDVAGDVPTDFWVEVRGDLEAIRPGFFMLAEASKPELLANAFDADYAWPMMAALNRVVMEGAPATDIEKTWNAQERQAFPAGSIHMRCSDNHDEARAVARFGWNGALASSVMMFTLDGIPLIYNGMEVGDASESADPALFEKVPIFWHSKGRDAFRDTYRQLISLRHEHAALTHGSVVWLENSAPSDVVSFLRRGEAEELVTVVNFSNRPRSVQVNAVSVSAFKLLLGSKEAASPSNPGSGQIALGPFGWRIYQRSLKP